MTPVVVADSMTVVYAPQAAPSSGGSSSVGIIVGVVAAVAVIGGAMLLLYRRRSAQALSRYSNATAGFSDISAAGTLSHHAGSVSRPDPLLVEMKAGHPRVTAEMTPRLHVAAAPTPAMEPLPPGWSSAKGK